MSWNNLDYDHKKAQAEKRFIPFSFTREQWIELHEVQKKTKCPYTNEDFIFKQGHNNSPSLERINQTKGYTPDNCVWVTKRGNRIKADYIENNLTVPNGVQPAVTRIKRIIESVENIQRIQEPYRHLFNKQDDQQEKETKMNKENELTGTLKKPEAFSYENKEIVLAKRYSNFGDLVERKCEGTFSLTFTQFKTKMNRKSCQLTGKPFEDDLKSKTIYIIDKTKPVDSSNVLIVKPEIQEALDKLCSSVNIGRKGLVTICKNLIK